MTELFRPAKLLLADMAAAHGVPELVPDQDGLVPIDIGGLTVALCFNPAWESVFVLSVLSPAPSTTVRSDPYHAIALRRRFAGPRTRVAVERETGALVLVTEESLMGLTYADFAARLDGFVGDLRLARQALLVDSPPVVKTSRPDDMQFDIGTMVRV